MPVNFGALGSVSSVPQIPIWPPPALRKHCFDVQLLPAEGKPASGIRINRFCELIPYGRSIHDAFGT